MLDELAAVDALELQVAVPGRLLADECAALVSLGPPGGGPSPIGVLPATVASTDLPAPVLASAPPQPQPASTVMDTAAAQIRSLLIIT